MSKFTSHDIAGWEKLFRVNFINSLTGFKSVSLIGTVDKGGRTNLAVVSSVVHIGSNPPLIGYVNRPLDAAQHTITNILETNEYTLNHVHISFLPAAHQSSARYPEGTSEFRAVGLSPEFLDNYKSPFVKESNVKYALSLEEVIGVGSNKTILVIGRVKSVYIADDVVDKDGFIRLDMAGSLCSNGLDAYYSVIPEGRFSYAKPDRPLTRLN